MNWHVSKPDWNKSNIQTLSQQTHEIGIFARKQ